MARLDERASRKSNHSGWATLTWPTYWNGADRMLGHPSRRHHASRRRKQPLSPWNIPTTDYFFFPFFFLRKDRQQVLREWRSLFLRVWIGRSISPFKIGFIRIRKARRPYVTKVLLPSFSPVECANLGALPWASASRRLSFTRPLSDASEHRHTCLSLSQLLELL